MQDQVVEADGVSINSQVVYVVNACVGDWSIHVFELVQLEVEADDDDNETEPGSYAAF